MLQSLWNFDGKAYAPIHDHNGSVRSIINPENQKTEEFYRYSAFGEEQAFDAHGEPLENPMNPWRFSSKRTDSKTGLVYFGHRYYHPSLGRWISKDPLQTFDGPNQYAFVHNKSP